MTNALACFLSTFVAVFALGLQSLNVNQGHRWAARFTSLLIGTSHIALYRFMPGASWPEVAAYLAGGVAGIDCSMWFHRVAKVRLEAWRDRRRLRAAVRQAKAQRPPAPIPARPIQCDRALSGYPPCVVPCGDCVATRPAGWPGDTKGE